MMNRRASWNDYFMGMACYVSSRSTCLKLQTGAVIVKNKKVISTGYNGSVQGAEHCDEYWHKQATDNNKCIEDFLQTDEFLTAHHEWAKFNELHGEANALSQAECNIIDAQMYSVYSPCIECAKMIFSRGISTVFYLHEYQRDRTGIDFLEKHNVPCIRLLENPLHKFHDDLLRR